MDPTKSAPNLPHAAAWLLIAILATLACSGERSVDEQRLDLAMDDSGEIVVAAVWPWKAHADILYREGLELALEEVNRQGGPRGRPLRLRYEDDDGSVNQGRLVAQRLAGDPEVMAVIGHLQSFVTVPAAAIYDLAGLVLLAPTATSADLTSRSYQRVFRTTFTDVAVGRQMADYGISQGYQRMAIYYIRNDYGRDLANAFEERLAGLGHSVAARDSYDWDDEIRPESFKPIFDRWRQLELDAIFLAGEVPSAGRLIAEFRRGGIDIPLFGGDALFSSALLSAAGTGANGTVVPAIFHPEDPRPEVQSFVRRFEEAYDALPDAGSALGYDALRLLAHAMDQAPSLSSEDLAKTLHTIDSWQGVTGGITFDAKGDLKSVRLLKVIVRDGAFHYLPEEPAGG